MLHKIPIEGKWLTFDDKKLSKLPTAEADLVRNVIEDYERNPLSYFLPHGRPWSDKVRTYADGKLTVPPSEYPKEWGNDTVAFLNDRLSDICLMVAPNQVGKSHAGVVWSALRIIPTDPDWPIYGSGVQHVPFTQKKNWVVASYSWENVTTIWNHYKTILPRHELGPYAPNWGKFPGEKGRQKNLTFGDGRTKVCPLTCGSEIHFRCYTQAQAPWEGFPADGAQLDEQAPHEKFVGLQRAFTTRGDDCQVCMTLTGHELQDRPDTGAAGWIKRELWDIVQNMALSAATA